jgi:hypothetical protein
MGQHFAIHLLKVSTDLVSGFLLHMALLAYTQENFVVCLHSTVIFFFLLWLDVVTS